MKLIHYILYPLMLGCVVVLSWLCEEWSGMYDDLQAEQHKAARVYLRVLDNDVWLLINEKHLYQFPNACGRINTKGIREWHTKIVER